MRGYNLFVCPRLVWGISAFTAVLAIKSQPHGQHRGEYIRNPHHEQRSAFPSVGRQPCRHLSTVHCLTEVGVDDTNNVSVEPTCFVKYGEEDALVDAKTQMYFYNLTWQDDLAPRIPKVLRRRQ